MLQELNRRLEGLSFCNLRLFEDSSGLIWLEDMGDGAKGPTQIGTFSEAKGFVESLEKDERMIAVMS
ncbi:MAG TPA: hypothetical protein VMS77_08395 [Conexivisphaerales archaeon]|nr:hypothetical protein [Conexivisphaerales archaeon]